MLCGPSSVEGRGILPDRLPPAHAHARTHAITKQAARLPILLNESPYFGAPYTIDWADILPRSWLRESLRSARRATPAARVQLALRCASAVCVLP